MDAAEVPSSAVPSSAVPSDRTPPPPVPPIDRQRVQRRIVTVLAAAQVLGGLGMGSTLSLGALLIERISGEGSLSGLAATMITLGTAVVAFPLGRLAAARGRRPALAGGAVVATLGAALIIVAAGWGQLWLVLLGMALLGAGSAAGLQSRFAAADLAAPERRGRDLSMVVWATTVGVVIGPNLLEPGELLGAAIGLPPLSGAFLFTLSAQLLIVVLVLVALRPDPLLTALALSREAADAESTAPTARRSATTVLRERPAALIVILVIALSHAVMVAVMAMTPLHLTEHAAELTVVGIVISVHTAGMYALSPVFGWLSDRVGRVPVIVAGQAGLLAALVVNWFADGDHAVVGIALALLGLGWSAATVAGAALLTDVLGPRDRPVVQGFSDGVMSLAGAGGGAASGLVMAGLGYAGLNAVTGTLVAVALVLLLVLRRSTPARPEAPAATRLH